MIGRLPFTIVDDAPALFDAGTDFVSFTPQLLADAETPAKADFSGSPSAASVADCDIQ